MSQKPFSREGNVPEHEPRSQKATRNTVASREPHNLVSAASCSS